MNKPDETSIEEGVVPSSEAGMLGQRLDLKVGFSCNNRCIFCVQGDKRDHQEDRSYEALVTILEARRETSEGVVFTGGEATLRNDLVDLVREARDMGYATIQVQTNGRRLSYAPYMEALKDAGVTEVAPAIHGASAETHDTLTRSRGAFNQVVKGIRNARRLGLPVIMNSVVVKDNYRELPRLATLLARLDVTQFQFAYVHPAGTAEQLFEKVVPRFSEAVPFIHQALDVARGTGIRTYTEAVPYCFMRGYEEHVVEGVIPPTWVEDGPMVIEDYTAYRWVEGKAKGAPCEDCSFKRVCEGPWHEYPREFGWDEFSPRDDDPNRITERASG